MINTLIPHTQALITTAGQNIVAPAQPTIILGLSGGPDSVFLLHLLHNLQMQGNINLIAAHLNHEWRPEAARDVTFCQDLCAKLNIPFVAGNASQLDHPFKANGSKEELGRQLRRFFFEQIRTTHNGDLIALAHHRQDQQETFFLRLIRGTTLSGLRCMDAVDGRYIRPLLSVDKTEILSYLAGINQPYLNDPTNTSDAFLRNRIRNHLVPALHLCDQRFDATFDRTLTALKQEDALLQHIAEQNFNQLFTLNKQNGRFIGNRTQFCAIDPVLQRRVVMHWLITERIPFTPSTSFIDEILRFLATPTGGAHQIGTLTVLHKQQQRIWVDTPRPDPLP